MFLKNQYKKRRKRSEAKTVLKFDASSEILTIVGNSGRYQRAAFKEDRFSISVENGLPHVLQDASKKFYNDIKDLPSNNWECSIDLPPLNSTQDSDLTLGSGIGESIFTQQVLYNPAVDPLEYITPKAVTILQNDTPRPIAGSCELTAHGATAGEPVYEHIATKYTSLNASDI